MAIGLNEVFGQVNIIGGTVATANRRARAGTVTR